MKTIELTPIWITKDWSGEIIEGVGTSMQVIGQWGSEKTIYYILDKDGKFHEAEPKHAHASKEEAETEARKQLMDGADYYEKQVAEYKQRAMKLRSELIKFVK